MKIALVCPASLPATQFGGIMFLCVDIAKESSKQGHETVIFTTDLDFANNPKTFNKKLPRIEKFDKYIPILPILPSNGSKHLVWGKILEDFIIKQGGKKEEIVKIGSPRYDKFFKNNYCLIP